MRLFANSRLKVERAQKHIADLEAEIARFLESDFYRFFVDEDVQGRKNVLALRILTTPGPQIPLVLGDTVHNLRSALDHLVSDVVVSKLGQTSDRLTFPIWKKGDELVRAIERGEIHQANPTIAKLIVDSIKPYPGGNDALWSLHKLDLMDKHRLLVPLIQFGGVGGFEAHDDAGNRFVNCSFTAIGENRYRCILMGAEVHIDNYGKTTFDVLFPKGLGIEGKAVVPTLHYFVQLVNGIIDAFEAVCLSNQS